MRIDWKEATEESTPGNGGWVIEMGFRKNKLATGEERMRARAREGARRRQIATVT